MGAAAFWCCAAPVAAEPSTTPLVSYSAGRLSVQPRGQPLSAVLREVAAATGAVVKGAEALGEPVRWNLDQVLLADGLRRLLAHQNFVLIEGAPGHATRVFVLAAASVASLPAAAQPVLQPIAALDVALASRDAASRIEAIERAGAQDDARSLELIRRALNETSDAVRAVATEALAQRQSRFAGQRRGAAKSSNPIIGPGSG